ncbi:hypothetical protein GS496_17300 [Rhodococcus hoagii]|nr:hypothetical protein [Prescottella equi]NKS42305.1 hypothetical protein [Prescottella equi]
MASTAEIAIASGVHPGLLDSYLSLIDRTAASVGVPPTQVAPIFNRIHAADRVRAADIKALADLGLPIVHWLSLQMGIPERLVSAVVAEGQVGPPTFFAAIANRSG